MTDEQWQQIQQAIWNAEQSNGNYTSYNENSGAAGAYQFMPETWAEKANLYGYSEYANVPNASYAPPNIQDAVARAWADDLLNKYNGDPRYVADAWLSGESAADEDYANGSISSTRSDGNITALDYVARSGLNIGLPTESVLDTSVITTNNPDQSVTNTDNLRPEAIYGANTIGTYMMANFGVPVMITGGAEIGYHAKSSTGHGHEDGWKIDIANDQIAGGTQAGTEFKEFCNNQGWSCNWEDDHWDIDFSGSDSRDPQRGGFTGNFFGETFKSMQDEYGYDYLNQMMSSPQINLQAQIPNVDTPSFWDKLSTGFMDGLTTTGAAYVAQSLWGNLFHSSNHFGYMDKVTQEDIDYVKNALPNDIDAQKFALLNGRDSEEIKWLVNQKLVDKQRQEKIAQFNDGCTFTIANAARMVGSIVDPTMLIPVGTAFNGLKITARLGNAIYDMSKVSRIASKAARMGVVNKTVKAAEIGASNAIATTADNVLREKYGGINMSTKEYAWDAALSFTGGAVLGAVGGLFKNIGKKQLSQKIAEKADEVETKAIYDAADVDMSKVRNETIGEALKIHDTNYGKTLKSNYYTKLEQNNRVISTSYEKARNLVSRASGIEIPKSAKAFYVPNEDYTILIKDNIKPQEIDSILAHEFSVHAGLKNLVGEKNYNALMDDVARLATKEGHVFNEARRKAGSLDPEETLAYAVENDMLPKGITSKLKGMINRGLKREGISSKITAEQVQGMLKEQSDLARLEATGLHFNADGTTAFAGIKFSKDNPLNPQMWANYFELEKPITKQTQQDLPFWFPNKLGRWLEQGATGVGMNSTSNTIRGITPKLFDDARGRGIGMKAVTIPADVNKERIANLLNAEYFKYADVRQNWTLKNKHIPSRASHMAFDKLTMIAFNSKYGGNKANVPIDLPDEAFKAADILKTLRDKQIELGKRSAADVGARTTNLIEADWKPVDNEMWRVVDTDMRQKFLMNFNTVEEAQNFLEDYYKRFVKRDVIKEKILRDIDKKNKKIQEANDKIPKGSTRRPEKLLDRSVSEAEIDEWINAHVPNAAKFAISGNYDMSLKDNIKALGSLSSLKERVPIDTSGVLKMPNGLEFSFDNNLRDYDLDSIVLKNINRFAGEAVVKNVFGTAKGLDDFLKKARTELQTAVKAGKLNQGTADSDFKTLEDSIYELRGMKPNVDSLNRVGALARIFRKIAYAKNGANMGFAQLGELGGTVAYGGLPQIAHVFKPLGDLIDNIRWGIVSTNTIKEVEEHIFGSNLESQIFNVNFGDRVARDALTEQNNLINKTLIHTSDIVSNLGKMTSALNMLPKMTDSMLRGMRTQTIMDSIHWAYGKKVSYVRNPFSKAKLKASGISDEMAEKIKYEIRKSTNLYKGTVDEFDWKGWQQASPVTFAKWYGMIQKQAERGIVSGNRIGNRNLFKDKNLLIQMAFQFKDYALRTINAQTMRAMTARDLDDAMAAMLGIVTNTAAYAVKAGATYGAIKASGADDKAKEYYDKMFSQGNLMRAAAFRSAIVGSPFSFVNDVLEGSGLVDTSIRTSVNRGNYGKPDNVGDWVGNIAAQMPAIQQANAPIDVFRYFYNASNNEANKRDFKKAIQALPLPNIIPLATFIDRFVDQSDYPDKRPKKNKE